MRFCSALVVASLFLGVFSSQSQAQVVPYKLTGSGVADPATGQFYGPSIATHFGNLSFFAQVTSLVPTFDGGGNINGFTYTGIDTQTAADGSEILLAGSGSAVLIPRPDLGPTMFEAYWDGEWNVVGGNKRFSNAGPGTGPIQLQMYQPAFDLLSDDLRPFVYVKNGDIDLGNKK